MSDDTLDMDDTWFKVEHVTMPFIIPTVMPVVVPGIVPFLMPIVVPTVVPLKIPMVLPDMGSSAPRAGGATWTPVPIEVVPDQRTEEPPQPTVPPVPIDATLTGPAALQTQTGPQAMTDAPEFPVKIARINKVSEIVTLENVSGERVDLTGWKLVSVLGEQEHRGIDGMLEPAQKRYFPNLDQKIWRDDLRDDGALYNADGQLVSYWKDES